MLLYRLQIDILYYRGPFRVDYSCCQFDVVLLAAVTAEMDQLLDQITPESYAPAWKRHDDHV